MMRFYRQFAPQNGRMIITGSGSKLPKPEAISGNGVLSPHYICAREG